ncbi:hypothetical protein [Prevotella koreensis]|uniref:hypothetical protein n=1 Tax=Prevotella koreensis TaxID=2490854 RepID=UPI003FA14A08
MKLNNLFANAASKALALAAAVMMMGMTFTACSSDNDDTPKFTNTVTLDSEVIKIEKLVLTEKEGIYTLDLQLESGKKAKNIYIEFIPSIHNDKLIKLTEQTDEEAGKWSIAANHGSLNVLFTGKGTTDPLCKFSSGTMKLNVNPTTKEVNVTVIDGAIKTSKMLLGDKLPHTISISYKGTAE